MDRSDWSKRMRLALVAGVCALSLGAQTLALPPDTASGTNVSGSNPIGASPLFPVVQSAQAGQVLTGTTFRVLQSWRVKLADHSVIFNRVETPPVSSPTPTPVAQPQTPDSGDQKAQRMISLSATVYDHRITDLRWSAGAKQFRVFTNIDFQYFCTVGGIETANIDYELNFGLGTATMDDSLDAQTLAWLTRAKQQLPDPVHSLGARASYLVATGSVADDPDGFAALDALHVYFNAHRAELIQAYRQVVAEAAAQKLYLRLHPPVVKDTVINFWRKQGSSTSNRGN